MNGVALAAFFVIALPGEAGQEPSIPVEATLTVRLAAGKSTYALGELVPLELEFRGQAGPDYYFWTGNYDRSGRMPTEQYRVAPERGFEDPLADYFASFGGPGGGLGAWHSLDGKPFPLRVYLNEWVRFTQPGDYELVVSSGRLERYSGRPTQALVSDAIALHITPATPEWAAAEAARAIVAIEGGQSEEARRGIAILRHLGTKDAALALVSHHGAGGAQSRFDLFAGLVASPYRADVVKAMAARIDAGEPVPPRFVLDLSFVRNLVELPVGANDPRLRFDRLNAVECDYTERWTRAIARRGPTPAALAAVLATREEASNTACETAVADLLARHPGAARDAFLALPASTQAYLLEHRWATLDRGWIGPALETRYENWTGDSRIAGVGDQALKRLVAIDPPKGRSLLVDEIRTGKHGLAPDTLTSLVDRPLPALDDALRERYDRARSDDDRAATMWLLARYGSASLVPFVEGELERSPACALEAAALAYLLVHDPPAAVIRLQPGFDRGRRDTCAVPPLHELAPRHWDERVEDAAIALVQGREPFLVSYVAQILGTHGSARVKLPLFERLVQWEEEWRGREKELDEGRDANRPGRPNSPVMIEGALVNALFGNRRIALTPAEIERIRTLCVTNGCRENVSGLVRARSSLLTR